MIESDSHLKRWGFIWLIFALFIVSWGLQFVTMLPEIHEKGLTDFWAATFENWQSEFLQLAVQAVLIQSWISQRGFSAKAE